MENLSAFFRRVEPDEKKREALFKRLAERIYFVMAFDTTEEIKLIIQDGGGEWVSYSDEPPQSPLKAIVIRQSDGTATDSPYNFLEEVWKHCRKVLIGLSRPDWSGLLLHAYITGDFSTEWEKSAIGEPPKQEQEQPTTAVAVEGLGKQSEQAESQKPLPRQRHQENEILRAIGALGHTACKLPKPAPGKSGVKAEVRKAVKMPNGIFNKAWERLRARGEIGDTV